MGAKVGIYIPGLGENYRKESAEKYASRFVNQVNYGHRNSANTYSVQHEKVVYDEKDELYTNKISITEHDGADNRLLYRFYEFQYAKELTKEFDAKNVFAKSFLLATVVIGKLPLALWRILYVGKNVGYRPRHRGEAFFVFTLFTVMSAAILFLLPAAIALLTKMADSNDTIKHTLEWLNLYGGLGKFSQQALNVTALILILAPGANLLIAELASEFTCASNYLNVGMRKQKIHGAIDRLIEHIVEQEGDDVELVFHSYSFGSVLTLDYLFPFGIEPSTRLQNNLKGLVTIGCPYDFVRLYFPRFFRNRNSILAEKGMKWLNVYSMNDALGSNFRRTATTGAAEYSIVPGLLPVNLNYEVANINMNVFVKFFSLYSIRAHSGYWDAEDDGQSCLRQIVAEMKKNNML